MPGPRPTLCTFPDDFLQAARHAVRRRTISVRDAQRYQLVLLLDQHPDISHTDAARIVGFGARQVQRWRTRWASGDYTVIDRVGRGRKPAFSPD